jgi:signal transduction histidine kinase
MTDNCTIVGEGEIVKGPATDEIADLRARLERLVLASDAERRAIERSLHDGLQQQLVGLAADLELASMSLATDPDATARLLEDSRSDLRRALEEARALAHRIYPPLDAGGLAAALRFAAASADVPTRIDVEPAISVPSEIVAAVYFCCLDLLGRVEGTGASIAIRERDGGVVFEVVADGEVDAEGSPIRDRVEALGGSLDVRSGPPTVVSGFVPVSR